MQVTSLTYLSLHDLLGCNLMFFFGMFVKGGNMSRNRSHLLLSDSLYSDDIGLFH